MEKLYKTLTDQEFLDLPAGTKIHVSYDDREAFICLNNEKIIYIKPNDIGNLCYNILECRKYDIFIGSCTIAIILL